MLNWIKKLCCKPEYSFSKSGNHDWGYIEELNEHQILYNAFPKEYFTKGNNNNRYYQRVCLICHKCEDTITPKVKELRERREKEDKGIRERKELIEKLWEKRRTKE